MTGGDIIATLLRAEPAIIAFLAGRDQPQAVADQIKLGRFPDGVALPAWLVRNVSRTERQPLKRIGYVRVTERVSVAVRAASYRDMKAAIDLAMPCAGRTGDIGGGLRVAILTAGRGPDLDGPGNSFERTQDFSVSFDDFV